MNMSNTTELSRTERKRRARRENILETAIELVAKEGLPALTIHRLAELLDYSPGALYRYFPSKDALLAELQTRALADVHEKYKENDQAAREWPGIQKKGEAVQGLFRALASAHFYLSLARNMPYHAKLVTSIVGSPEYVLPDEELGRMVPTFLGLLKSVDSLFTDLQKQKALMAGDAPQRTAMYWSCLQGIAQAEKFGRIEAARFSGYPLGIEAASSLLLGWGAGQKPLQQAQESLARWVEQN